MHVCTGAIPGGGGGGGVSRVSQEEGLRPTCVQKKIISLQLSPYRCLVSDTDIFLRVD